MLPIQFLRPSATLVSHERLQLDLDDIESDIWSQITKLHQLNGNTAGGLRTVTHLAAAYQQLEERVLPTVARIFVCSAHDRAKLKALYQCQQVTVLPNVYPLPEKNEHKPGAGKFRLLFVGSLGYEPNADAILYFCDRILPLLRKVAASQFELQIIGAGRLISKQARKKLAQHPEIMLTVQVDNVAPFYQQADAVIVPLRAGAGTRVKILEAFAWQVPVVSTSKGVEGLEVKHGQHALIADTPADFARQCVQLMADPSLRDKLVQNGKSLVQSKYSPAQLIKILCQ